LLGVSISSIRVEEGSERALSQGSCLMEALAASGSKEVLGKGGRSMKRELLGFVRLETFIAPTELEALSPQVNRTFHDCALVDAGPIASLELHGDLRQVELQLSHLLLVVEEHFVLKLVEFSVDLVSSNLLGFIDSPLLGGQSSRVGSRSPEYLVNEVIRVESYDLLLIFKSIGDRRHIVDGSSEH